jgi:hypothetical protein
MRGRTQGSGSNGQALDDLLHQAVCCVFISMGIIHLCGSLHMVPNDGAM